MRCICEPCKLRSSYRLVDGDGEIYATYCRKHAEEIASELGLTLAHRKCLNSAEVQK